MKTQFLNNHPIQGEGSGNVWSIWGREGIELEGIDKILKQYFYFICIENLSTFKKHPVKAGEMKETGEDPRYADNRYVQRRKSMVKLWKWNNLRQKNALVCSPGTTFDHIQHKAERANAINRFIWILCLRHLMCLKGGTKLI